MKASSIHSEKKIDSGFEPSLIKRLISYFKPYKSRVFISVLILLIVAGLEQLGPYLTKIAIDEHIFKGDFPGLVRIVLLYAALASVLTLAKVAQAVITGWVGEQTMADLRKETFTHIHSLSVSFFDRNPVGRLVTRTTGDIQTLNEIFSSGIVVLFGDLITLIWIVTAMILLNAKLALVAVAVLPLLIAVSFYFRGRLRDAFREVRVRVAAINAFLQEHLSGMRIVQLFNREQHVDEEFAAVNRKAREGHLMTVRLFSVFFPAMEILSALSVALILVRGGYLILDDTLALGTLVAFFQYGERFFRPIRDIAEKYNIFQAGIASAERVFELLDTRPEMSQPSHPVDPEHEKGSIEFDHVSFSYDGKEDVLRDISFRVDPGKTVAIVGATGSGKSTIANLVGRFYDVRKGAVKVNDVDVRKQEQERLLRNISYVHQDVFIFQGSIRENLTLGEPCSDAEIRSAAETVHADTFINALPKGFNEILTERGSILSSGQRQLLSFARALIRRPKILVLDEATSSIDPETESLIQDALEKLLENRTSIIIAHRLSTIRRADHILVLHKGRICEQGTHEELLELKGIYYNLYHLQFASTA